MDAIQKIKESLSKELIHELLGANCYDTGNAFRCACPIHNGSNPTAFVFSYDNFLWFCHSGDCGGGDIFDFIRATESVPPDRFEDLVVLTAQKLHIDIENLEVRERPNETLREIRNWISYVSGITITENPTYDLAFLGPRFALTSYRNFTPETIVHFKGCYSQVYNRIAIPLYQSGNCVGVSLRRLQGLTEAKWLHLPKHVDTRTILYNLDNCTGDKVYIVEGPFDAWNLYQIGITNVVSTLGSHITSEQERLLVQNFTDICFAFDNDKAGHQTIKKGIEKLKHKANLSVLDLGMFSDPGEIDSMESFSNLIELPYYNWSSNIV